MIEEFWDKKRYFASIFWARNVFFSPIMDFFQQYIRLIQRKEKESSPPFVQNQRSSGVWRRYLVYSAESFWRKKFGRKWPNRLLGRDAEMCVHAAANILTPII